MSVLRVAAFEPRSEVNGPGVRAVVWVQGCPREPICPGCYNPAFLPMQGPAEIVTASEMAARIFALPDIAGITLSGGEPFAQAAALAALARLVKSRGLTVMVFSGRTLRELRASNDPSVAALLAETDLLVDGPFVRERRGALPLRSSDNQELHFLSGRIRPEDVDSDASSGGGANDAVEIVVDSSGDARATGLVDASLLRELAIKLRGARRVPGAR